jgi:hypothetical protein
MRGISAIELRLCQSHEANHTMGDVRTSPLHKLDSIADIPHVKGTQSAALNRLRRNLTLHDPVTQYGKVVEI